MTHTQLTERYADAQRRVANLDGGGSASLMRMKRGMDDALAFESKGDNATAQQARQWAMGGYSGILAIAPR